MIILHCGSFEAAERSYYFNSYVKQNIVVEQGVLSEVDFIEKMVTRFASGAENTFSNSYMTMLALKIAVKRGLVSSENVLVIHHTGIGKYDGITIGPKGEVNGWAFGVYDGLEYALTELTELA